MSFKRILAIFIRQMLLVQSNPTRLIGVFLWIVIDVILWGFISRYLGILDQANFTYATAILGAIILWGFMIRIQQGTMTAFLEDIWSQNFINMFASPLRVSEYLSGLVLTSVAMALAGFAAVIALAGAAFGFNIFRLGLALLPFLMILFVFGLAMGIFASALIFRLGPPGEWLGWPIPMVMSVFVGVFYPLSVLPATMQAVGKFIPASYVFEGMRAVIAAGGFAAGLGSDLARGFLLALMYLAAMYYFFLRTYRRNLKTGQIARFNSESF